MLASGYSKSRFTGGGAESFLCGVCGQVVRNPVECVGCGKLACQSCYEAWSKTNPECPTSGCNARKSESLKSKAHLRLYQNLDIKCSNPDCGKVIKLSDLAKHESQCMKKKCWNSDLCSSLEKEGFIGDQPSCSQTCKVLGLLMNKFGNVPDMYRILKENYSIERLMPIGDVTWDERHCGTGIAISSNGKHVFLKETAYIFRSVLANCGFTSGINYWEIKADPKTENELKIGVATSQEFELNSAFCDHAIGFAYYGLAQLRHNSNATGPVYGSRFKKDGVLGVCLNMIKGTLSFSLNGKDMGVAFTSPKLC